MHAGKGLSRSLCSAIRTPIRPAPKVSGTIPAPPSPGPRIAAGWSYPDPGSSFAGIAGHVAFYPEPFDEVLVDGEQVVPQPGGFYGGWITSGEAGPFKGITGSQFW